MSQSVADLAAHLRLEVNKSSFAQGEKLIHNFHRLVEGFIGFEAVKKISEFFTGIVEGAVESAHGIEVLAQQIGVATGPLQELEYAARATGSSTEALTTGVGHFALVLGEANKGSKEAAKSLSGLGPEVLKLLKANAPLEDVLAGVAEKFHSMPDGTKKTALAMQVFGRGGRELIPMLNKGKEGLDELRKEFVALGGELSNGDMKQLDGLRKTSEQLGVVWLGIKNQIALALVPALKDVADSVLAWVKKNRELINTKIHEYINLIIEKAREFWAWIQEHKDQIVAAFVGIKDAIVSVGNVVGTVTGAVGGLGNAVEILMALWAASKLFAIAKGFIGIATAIKAAQAAKLAASGAVSVGGDLGLAATSASTAAAASAGTGTAASAGLGLATAVGAASAAAITGTIIAGLATGGAIGATADWATKKISGRGISDRIAGVGNEYSLQQAAYRGTDRAKHEYHVTSPITVNVPAGADGKAIGGFVQQAFRDFWEQQMRDTHADVSQ